MFVIGANSASTGYNLTRSLRFRASASGYLNRTPATTTNQQLWTWSGWVKRGGLSSFAQVLTAGATSITNGYTTVGLNSTGSAYIVFYSTASHVYESAALFRDPASWYHIVFAVDTTQATASNRIKMYVNGVQITLSVTSGYTAVPQNFNCAVNSTASHIVGALRGGAGNIASFFDGYLTEVNFIDGQALTPSSFGSTNALTGVWQAARYTGSYGTNGGYENFTDNSALTTSSNVGLGKDFSGNGNYWTTNNISITTGVTYDSMTDVPTLTSATAANFAVLNPVDKASGVTTSNANLRATTGAAYDEIRATLAVSTKSYFEVTNSGTPSGSYAFLAGFQITQLGLSAVSTARANEFRIISRSTTDVQSGTSTLFSPTAVGNGEVIQFAIDVAAGKAWIGRASAWYNSTGGTTGDPATGANPTFTFTATEVYAVVGGYSVDLSFNAGQRPFAYTPPTGFVALNTYNLPTSTIVKGNTVMDATLYTGNGSTQTITNAAAFKPDLVWIKGRSSSAQDHTLVDSVRGVSRRIRSNATTAEVLESGFTVTAFNSSGFTAVDDTNGGYNVNGSIGGTFSGAAQYVGWQWQAGQGTTSSNANGTITSTVSVNASAGFSVVTYTGTNTGTPSPMPTVGHGLGVAPSLIISKSRNLAGVDSGAWFVWTSAQATDNYLRLNTTAASASISGGGGGTMVAPTSSVFSTPYLSGSNVLANNYVAYCWTPIAGFSAFGSYTGNGSADGTFVYLGFRPKFVMFKRTDGVSDWAIVDSSRSVYNVCSGVLFPDLSNAESSSGDYGSFCDFLSNGFKLRSASTIANTSATIYMAFAESPFRNSLAR